MTLLSPSFGHPVDSVSGFYQMVQEDGILVHQGKVPRGFNWDSAVEAIRDEQIKNASGL